MGEKEYTEYWEKKIASGKQDIERKRVKSEEISVGARILIVLIGGLLVLAGAWLTLTGLFYQMGSSMGNPS